MHKQLKIKTGTNARITQLKFHLIQNISSQCQLKAFLNEKISRPCRKVSREGPFVVITPFKNEFR